MPNGQRIDLGKLPPPSPAALWIGGTLLLGLLYFTVIRITSDEAIGQAVMDSAANVGTLAIAAAATRAMLKSFVMNLSVLGQALAHAVLAVLFTFAWYAMMLTVFGLYSLKAGQALRIQGFPGPAFAWQLFQGLILYAMVAAICYAIRGGPGAAPVIIGDARKTSAPDRYLTRSGDTIVPVRVDEIVSITGAQDYSEVSTTSGSVHLVRLGLGEFEGRLDPARFVRIHRSTIINLDHVASLESAGGGRMLATMANGEALRASRAGTATLRQFVV